MGIRDSLVLDHFYIGVENAEFDALIELKNILNRTTHGKSKVQGDEWEGIYVQSRTAAYFEIFRAIRKGGFGLCFSPMRLTYTDPSRIVNELKDEPWQVGTRIFDDGQKWYDWISTGNYLDHQNVLFNTWIMKYHLSHRESSGPFLPPTVDKFRRIHLSVGRENVEEIRRLSSWFPGTRTFESEKIQFHFQDRDGYPFEVFIDLISGNDRFQFLELEMKIDTTNVLKPLDREVRMGPFLLRPTGERLQLLRGPRG